MQNTYKNQLHLLS